jgi:hypothetical protein
MSKVDPRLKIGRITANKAFQSAPRSTEVAAPQFGEG